MEKDLRERLFGVIQKDDVSGFGAFVTPEVLSCIFGRFPLLSLLYLYDAKRIVKRYLAELLKERPHTAQAGFPQADDLFRKKAGKCLRYYADAVVSPLEMLAVLGKRSELVKLYKVYPGASRVLPMIHKIYFTRLGEGVTVIGDKLVLPKEPLPFALRKRWTTFVCVFLSLFVLLCGVTSFVYAYYGVGSEKVAYKARSEQTALEAMQKNSYVRLEKDLSFSETVTEFSAVLDGENHIVRLRAPFMQKLTGEIKDVIFVLEEGFAGDAVILENEGTLKNVRVVAEERTLSKGGEYMGLLTAVNKGTIDGCGAVMNVTIGGDAGGDCYFAPFAGSNEGTIQNCRADGSITGTVVDVAGIAGTNQKTGIITDCVVVATLSESSTIDGWTPNVAGVSAHNEGTIYGCTVSGKVTSTLIAPETEEEARVLSAYAAGMVCVNVGSVKNCTNESEVVANAQNGAAFAGGIVTLNTTSGTGNEMLAGTVEHCLSKAKIEALSDKHNSYAGGIAAYNEDNCSVSECGQTQSVSASSPDEIYDFTGGIVGRNCGTVTKSFFTGTLAPYDEDSLVGAICGLTYLYGDGFFSNYMVAVANCAYVKESVAAHGGLYLVTMQRLYSAKMLESGSDAGMLELGAMSGTLDEVKATEVYYE